MSSKGFLFMNESEMVSRQLSFHLSALNLFCFVFYPEDGREGKKNFVDVYIGVWSFVELHYKSLKQKNHEYCYYGTPKCSTLNKEVN